MDGPVLTIREHTLVRHALHVVKRAAKRVARLFRRFVEPEELLAVGTIELCAAARQFDAAYSHNFADYAYRRVRCAMVKSVAQDMFQERVGRAVEIATDQFWAYLTDREFDVLKHDEDEARRRLRAIANGMLGAAFMSGVEEAQRITPGEEVPEQEEYALAMSALRGALTKVATRDHPILAALYRDLMSTAEAVEALGIPLSSFKRRHAAALAQLHKALVEQGVPQAPRPRVVLDPGCVLGLPQKKPGNDGEPPP
jgi:RNA polymerase sigma factor (sigma-70 family)